jgi:Peptidase inhibitor family I36
LVGVVILGALSHPIAKDWCPAVRQGSMPSPLTQIPKLSLGNAQRRRSRRIIRCIAAVVAGLLISILPSAHVEAVTTRMTIGPGLASCPAGYVCLWPLSDFAGGGYAFFNSESNYATLPSPFNAINNNSWSFYSHGNTYDIRFHRGSGWTGDTFVLCRGLAIAFIPPNADIDPPAGTSWPGFGWRDQISSHKFGDFC